MGLIRSAAADRRVFFLTVGIAVCLSTAPAYSGVDPFDLGFHNSSDKTELSWLAQPGATSYQLLRSTLGDFAAECVTFGTSELFHSDATQPMAGGSLYYMVREMTPIPGGWGTDSGGSARPVFCLAPHGTLVDFSGCNALRETSRTFPLTPTPDCIEYAYVGEGRVLLTHVNTAFNCCPEFEAGIVVDGAAITIREEEISGDCDCNCLYDLDYEIVNLEPGIYQVTVTQEYLYQDDEPLEFTMDLLSSPSGSHCVERDHYPW